MQPTGESPASFMSANPAKAEFESEKGLDPQLTQARLRVQTIQRFQALNRAIDNIVDRQEQERAWAKLDALATQELGKVWEVLKKPDVEMIPMMIGGKTKDELKTALLANSYRISDSANEILDHSDFFTLPQSEPVGFIRLPVGDFGFTDPATTDQIFAKAEDLGLELCPPEVGPWYRIHTPNQPMGEYAYIGMRPIVGVDGDPCVFVVEHDRKGRSLNYEFARPDETWPSGCRFLFRLPLLNPEPTGVKHE